MTFTKELERRRKGKDRQTHREKRDPIKIEISERGRDGILYMMARN